VFHDEQEGVPENTVTQVLQKGYQIGDKILRHAMVKVSN
jgi:molecular chaperone GrpE